MAFYFPPEPLVDPRTGAISFAWLRTLTDIAAGGGVLWANIDFTGSNFNDIATRSASDLASGTVPLARLSGITTAQLAAAAAITLAQLATTGTPSGATFLRGDATFARITKTACCFSTGSIGAGVTNYIGTLGNNATEVNVQMVSPVSGTFRNLYIVSEAAPGAGQTFTYTLRTQGSDRAVTATISGAVATSASDTSNTFAIAAGEVFSVKVVTSAGAVAAHHAIGLELATA